MATNTRTRFAPSPTGYLHVGGARTALFSWLYARKTGGKFILRIEDTDQARSTEESLQMVLSDLKWLGLSWDEGPEVGGEYEPYKQSERQQIYAEHANRLLQESKAYYCFCTDEELEEKKELAKKEGRPPQYDGKCRSVSLEEAQGRLAKGEKAAVRFRVPEVEEYVHKDLVRGEIRFPTNMVGDFIILRSDGMPVYNFCCSIDDALMSVTHVLRAEEHLSNTLRQIMLYEAFPYPVPQMGHVSLILGQDKQKLSKRHGATSVNEYKRLGYLPEAVNNFLALLGWSSPQGDEIMSMAQIQEQFDLDRLNPAPAVFDEVKMKWMNATHLRALDHQDLWQRMQGFLKEAGMDPETEETWQSKEWQDQALGLFKTSMETLLDGVKLFSYLSEARFELAEEAQETLSWESSKAVVGAWLQELESSSASFLSAEDFEGMQNQIKDACGVKGKFLFMPIRVAVIGMPHGAELKQLVPLIERKNLIRRAKKALEKCV